MLGSLKNRAITTGLKVAINSKISRYGKVLKLELDTTAKSISMQLDLLGEQELITLTIDNYIVDIASNAQITLNGIHTSRRWLDMVASDFIEGKTFTIPPKYSKHLNILV